MLCEKQANRGNLSEIIPIFCKKRVESVLKYGKFNCKHRVLYAFDPRRTAILLIGGNKTSDNRWYEKYVPIADNLYEQHIDTLKKEGLINE